jgi:hypothetical protein
MILTKSGLNEDILFFFLLFNWNLFPERIVEHFHNNNLISSKLVAIRKKIILDIDGGPNFLL